MKTQILRPLFPSEAQSLGVSWRYALGIKANPNAGREFILTNGMLSSSRFDRIEISRRFNLGNHVRQVSNAVRFAELHRIPIVRLPPGSAFTRGVIGSVELREHEDDVIAGQRFLKGDFFYFEQLGISLERLERGRIINDLRQLVPLLKTTEMKAKLGIHLRSGDTFSSNPHPLYMPPPLKFFLSSIERSQASRTSGVHVICQDFNHPYVAPIVDFCKQNGIIYDVTSSTLDEDFKSLASFEDLCISQGTLALAAAWLSGGCKRIFAFERDASEMLTTAEMGIRVESATAVQSLGPWSGKETQMNQLSDPSVTDVNWESISARAIGD